MNIKLLFTLSTIILASTQSFAERLVMDHRGGNGGLGIAPAYTIIAQNISTIWEDICKHKADDEEAYCTQLEEFKAMLNKDSDIFVSVTGRPDLTGHDGEARDATNDGVGKIEVNTSESSIWYQPNINNDIIRLKIINVIHEYATLMRLDFSDTYPFSTELYSLFVRKRYKLGEIVSDHLLPDRCSTKISAPSDGQLYKNLKEMLSENKYKVRPGIQTSRYTLRVYSTCSTETFSNTCGVFLQQIDTFRNLIVKNKFIVDNQHFTSDKAILESLIESAGDSFGQCR